MDSRIYQACVTLVGGEEYRGWKTDVANILDLSPGYISKLLSDKYDVTPSKRVERKLREKLRAVSAQPEPKKLVQPAQPAPRRRRKRLKREAQAPQARPPARSPRETDAELLARVRRQFESVKLLLRACIHGSRAGHRLPGVVIWGPPGIGKTYPALRMLREAEDLHVEKVKGGISAPGLYERLWETRNGGVVLIDDSDEVFRDEQTLNLLKAALDSGERFISWSKQAKWLVAKDIDNSFTYKGTVIFLSNLNLDAEVDRGTKLSAHIEALRSRCQVLGLRMDTVRERLVYVLDAIESRGILRNMVEAREAREICDWMRENAEQMLEISLRAAVNLAQLASTVGPEWRTIAAETMLARACSTF